MKTLKEAMKPHGGLAALRFLFKQHGIEVSAASFQMYDRQAIPAKFAPIIQSIKEKHGFDLVNYVRKDKRRENKVGKTDTIYPLTLRRIKDIGIGLVASEINRPNNKADFFPINPPKRFNHYSLMKLLSKKLKTEIKDYLIFRFDLEKEIEADEKAAESGLLE